METSFYMIEVHGEAFSGQHIWQFRMGAGDVVRLSLGTSDFARISERDAFERIKSTLKNAGVGWIRPDIPNWSFKLEGLREVIGTRANIPWLTGAFEVKPEVKTDYLNASGTYLGTAEFVFYFFPETVRNSQTANDASVRNTVFVCYSHADKKWLDRLRVHLNPLQREGRLELFDDTRIHPGADWRKEIKSALSKARVAILLITADFLASDFIAEDELPPLLAKAQTGGATIIPVIVGPSRFAKTESLAKYQAANDPKIPLSRMGLAGREEVLARVADAVLNALPGSRGN